MGRLSLTVRPEPQALIVRDVLGNEIRPGALLAYPRRAGTEHWLNVLHVLTVDMDFDGDGAVGYATGYIVKSSRVKVPSRHGTRYQMSIMPHRISVRHAVIVREAK